MVKQLAAAGRVEVCRAGFTGDVAQVVAVVVIRPLQGGLALMYVAQLALALRGHGGGRGVDRKGAMGGSGHSFKRLR